MNKSFKLIISSIVLIASVFFFYFITQIVLSDDDSVFDQGLQYYNRHEYKAAKQLMQSEADRGNEKTYPYLGHIYLELGDYDNAVKYLKLTDESGMYESDPKFMKDVYYNLGYAYDKIGNPSESDKYLNKAEKLGSSEASNLLNNKKKH